MDVTKKTLEAKLEAMIATLRYFTQVGNWSRVEAIEPQIDEIRSKLERMEI